MRPIPDDPDAGFCEGPETEDQPALRLWVSQQQWQAILGQVESQQVSANDQNSWFWQRSEPRWPHRARCLIRISGQGGGGTFLVQTRNISSRGMGFLHGQPLEAGTRCTIALQTSQGQGRITAAAIVWARQVDQTITRRPAFEIGVQFDTPINLTPVLEDPAA